MALNDITRFADVPIEVEVELDRRVLSVREILELEEGSVIGMTRSAGENIDLYAGGKLMGYGEIVLIENSIGVRITDFNMRGLTCGNDGSHAGGGRRSGSSGGGLVVAAQKRSGALPAPCAPRAAASAVDRTADAFAASCAAPGASG